MGKVVFQFFACVCAALLSTAVGVLVAVGRDGFLGAMIWPLVFFPILFLAMFAGDFLRALRANSQSTEAYL